MDLFRQEASVKAGELIGIAQQVMALFPAVLNVGFAAVGAPRKQGHHLPSNLYCFGCPAVAMNSTG